MDINGVRHASINTRVVNILTANGFNVSTADTTLLNEIAQHWISQEFNDIQTKTSSLSFSIEDATKANKVLGTLMF